MGHPPTPDDRSLCRHVSCFLDVETHMRAREAFLERFIRDVRTRAKESSKSGRRLRFVRYLDTGFRLGTVLRFRLRTDGRLWVVPRQREYSSVFRMEVIVAPDERDGLEVRSDVAAAAPPGLHAASFDAGRWANRIPRVSVTPGECADFLYDFCARADPGCPPHTAERAFWESGVHLPHNFPAFADFFVSHLLDVDERDDWDESAAALSWWCDVSSPTASVETWKEV